MLFSSLMHNVPRKTCVAHTLIDRATNDESTTRFLLGATCAMFQYSYSTWIAFYPFPMQILDIPTWIKEGMLSVLLEVLITVLLGDSAREYALGEENWEGLVAPALPVLAGELTQAIALNIVVAKMTIYTSLDCFESFIKTFFHHVHFVWAG